MSLIILLKRSLSLLVITCNNDRLAEKRCQFDLDICIDRRRPKPLIHTGIMTLSESQRVSFFLAKDKASIAAAEVFNSVVLEFCSQKQKAVQLIPGADVKQFLGEGDDVIQTHVESGMALT